MFHGEYNYQANCVKSSHSNTISKFSKSTSRFIQIFKKRKDHPSHLSSIHLTLRTSYNFIKLIFIVSVSMSIPSGIQAQCNPPYSENCESANVLCSLEELNGYTCTNSSGMSSSCNPLCSQGGMGNNTSWWAFTTQGGNVSISLSIGSCSLLQGLQFGIWGDCNCEEEIVCRSIPCAPPASVQTINANLLNCKIYYLWIDGCSGDLCDFTIHTSGGDPPLLNPIGFINNRASKVIEPICRGACNAQFFVNPQPGNCLPYYEWRLDGNVVGSNSNEIRLDFPDEGDFMLCVTAYTGNPLSGSICSQVGPTCAIVKVRPIPDKLGQQRAICWEQANPGGYKWHSQRIFQSGTYREQFTDAACCTYDSLISFTVLDPPEPVEVYYISCDNTPYVDLRGVKWKPCQNHVEVPLPKSSATFHCDSSIYLTAVNVNLSSDFKMQCNETGVEISANIFIADACDVGESYRFEYIWYDLEDSLKNPLSTDERIFLQKPQQVRNYGLDIQVTTTLGTETHICTKSYPIYLGNGSGGPDFSKRGLSYRMKASALRKGHWSFLSGPGVAEFDSVNEADSRVHVSTYGSYCFLWTIENEHCPYQDTVCGLFSAFKKFPPDTIKRELDERNARRTPSTLDNSNIFTPSLIQMGTNSYLLIPTSSFRTCSYEWLDLTGTTIMREKETALEFLKKTEIQTPLNRGIYFLLIQANGQKIFRKVCIM